jgi:alpha-methylacyl-CoA racemase
MESKQRGWPTVDLSLRSGPLKGLRVLDFSATPPGALCSMLLAVWGADVIGISRPGAADPLIDVSKYDSGKRRFHLDLKDPRGAEVARRLACAADVVLEGFRPGVMERLGLGPAELHADNPKLVYARLTGFGQNGPLSARAGHDINYLAASGAMAVIDSPPQALLGDFAGGALATALGVVLALRNVDRTGIGDVVDASIVDAVTMLMFSTAQRGADSYTIRMISGLAPFYTTYSCADGQLFAVGAIEKRFFATLLEYLGIDDTAMLERQHDESFWPTMRNAIGAKFKERTRDEWTTIFADVDACAVAVVGVHELASNAHLAGRGTVTQSTEGLIVRAAPRLTNEPATVLTCRASTGLDVTDLVTGLAFSDAEIAALLSDGVVERFSEARTAHNNQVSSTVTGSQPR